MNRYCFLLRVRPDLLGEYRERHAAVHPDMLLALSAAGWHDYSLFLSPDGLLVGYFRAVDLAAAQAAMAATEANARWQEQMRHFFIGLGDGRPDEGVLLLEEVFHLEDQLAALLAAPDSPTSANGRTIA